MAGLDSNRGAKRAREARAALGLAPQTPLPCLLTTVERAAGLHVVVAALGPGVAGACFRDDARGAVLWVNGAQASVRQRFTLAHELGHVWCGHAGALEVDTFATVNGTPSSPLEVQANAFAAELLLPRAALEECIAGAPTLDEVVVLAAHYGVSAQVAVYRLKTSRLASGARVTQLLHEIDEGHHTEAFDRLGLDALEDRLQGVDGLPYLSPSLEGSALDAALHGRAGVDPALGAAVHRLLR